MPSLLPKRLACSTVVCDHDTIYSRIREEEVMSVVKRLRIPGVRQMYGWSGSTSDTTTGATLILVWRWLHDFLFTASWRVASLWPFSQVLTNKCLHDSASTEYGLVVDGLNLNWHHDVAGHRHGISCSCSACKYIVLLAPIATPILVDDVQCLSVVASDGPACECICLASAGLKANLRRLLSCQ